MDLDDRVRQQRAGALRVLVALSGPVEQAISELAQFDWDSDEELATLNRSDAVRVLHRYIDHELTANDCQRWANALEGRDDLALEAGSEDLLKQLLFELATPELSEVLTPEFAARWETALR